MPVIKISAVKIRLVEVMRKIRFKLYEIRYKCNKSKIKLINSSNILNANRFFLHKFNIIVCKDAMVIN
jgi:hypothetical protein